MATTKINGVYHVSNTQTCGGSGDDPNAVKYTPQTLTSEQQAQARMNIGVAGGGSGSSIPSKLVINTDRELVSSDSPVTKEQMIALLDITEEEFDNFVSGAYPIVEFTAGNTTNSVGFGSSLVYDDGSFDLEYGNNAYTLHGMLDETETMVYYEDEDIK